MCIRAAAERVAMEEEEMMTLSIIWILTVVHKDSTPVGHGFLTRKACESTGRIILESMGTPFYCTPINIPPVEWPKNFISPNDP